MLLTKVPVLDLIADWGGIRAIEIVRCLDGSNEIAETELATRLNMDMHVVRGTLQRLYESRLVRYRKERGQDGWWIYFWSLDPPPLIAYGGKPRPKSRLRILKASLIKDIPSRHPGHALPLAKVCFLQNCNVRLDAVKQVPQLRYAPTGEPLQVPLHDP